MHDASGPRRGGAPTPRRGGGTPSGGGAPPIILGFEPPFCEPLFCEPLLCAFVNLCFVYLFCEPLFCEPLFCEPIFCELLTILRVPKRIPNLYFGYTHGWAVSVGSAGWCGAQLRSELTFAVSARLQLFGPAHPPFSSSLRSPAGSYISKRFSRRTSACLAPGAGSLEFRVACRGASSLFYPELPQETSR